MIAPRSFGISIGRAWRSLRRRPGFFIIAVSSLAIALGLATTVIAEIDSLARPDLGTPHDDRLHLIGFGGTGRTAPTEAAILSQLRETALFEDLAPSTHLQRANIELGSMSGQQSFAYMSPHAFTVVGAPPLLGRWFLERETSESGVAIISEDSWRRRLGAPPSLEGIRTRIDGISYDVVGVAPRTLFFKFDDPSSRQSSGVLLPPSSARRDSGVAGLVIYARAKQGVGTKQIGTSLSAIAERLSLMHGAERPFSLVSIPLAWGGPLMMHFDGLHLAMAGAVAFIVLIACANVSALMLARAVAKRRDHALRLALGARRSDIISDVAAEVTIIGLAGAVAGVAVADATMRILIALAPADLPWLGFRSPHWSPMVFGALFVVVMVAVALASIVPALFVGRIAPAEQLKDESGNTTARPRRTFQILVAGELALSMILIFGSVLVARSASTVGSYEFGYDARGVAQVSVGVTIVDRLSPPSRSDAPNELRLYRREITTQALDDIVTRLRASDAVTNAAWADRAIDARMVMSDETFAAHGMLTNPIAFNVGPGFFATVGIPIIQGRDFTETDRMTRGAMVLDERAAQRLFPDGNAVGKLVKLGSSRSGDPWMTVVGVARNAMHNLPADPAMEAKAVVYVSRSPVGDSWPVFIARAAPGVRDVRPAIAAIVADLVPANTTYTASSWIQQFEQFVLIRRFVAGLFLTLSFASLALAAAGLFGVLSYAVNMRMREFAVRVALGATQTNVVKLVLTDGLTMVLGGTALGGFIAMYAAFAMWQWLWGVYPVDAPALLISEGVLISVMLVAAILPALRATRVNPVDVMRST